MPLARWYVRGYDRVATTIDGRPQIVFVCSISILFCSVSCSALASGRPVAQGCVPVWFALCCKHVRFFRESSATNFPCSHEVFKLHFRKRLSSTAMFFAEHGGVKRLFVSTRYSGHDISI